MASECRKQPGGSINRPPPGGGLQRSLRDRCAEFIRQWSRRTARKQKLHIIFHQLIELLLKVVFFHKCFGLT